MFDNNYMLNNNIMRELLNITKINHDNSLSSIVQAVGNSQTGWLRQGERWHQQEGRFNHDAEKILKLVEQLGYTKEVKPINLYYDCLVIMGTAAPRMKIRLNTLLKAWESGCRWSKIIMLGSDRSLSDSEPDKEIMDKVAAKNYEPTEFGMMQYLYNEVYKDKLPSELKKIKVLWVNTLRPAHKARADTDDTIIKWLQEDKVSNGSNILVVSSQPFIGYQDKVVKYVFAKTGVKANIETIGDKIGEEKENPILVLDSIARELKYYQQTIEKNK